MGPPGPPPGRGAIAGQLDLPAQPQREEVLWAASRHSPSRAERTERNAPPGPCQRVLFLKSGSGGETKDDLAMTGAEAGRLKMSFHPIRTLHFRSLLTRHKSFVVETCEKVKTGVSFRKVHADPLQ